MPERRPPVPDVLTQFHWDAAAEGRLEVQRCADCGRWPYPPSVGCPLCGGTDLVPQAVSGRGTIYSYTVSHRAYEPGFVNDVPYVVALVTLEESDDLRLLTNLVDIEADDIEVGMCVEVTFEALGDISLPQFTSC